MKKIIVLILIIAALGGAIFWLAGGNFSLPKKNEVVNEPSETQVITTVSPQTEDVTGKDKVIVPSIDDGYSFTGKTIIPIISGYTSDLMKQDGTTSASNAGIYSVVFSLIDKDKYCWADNTTGDKQVSWRIKAKDISGAIIEEIPEQKYTGSAIEPDLNITCVMDDNNVYTLKKDVDYTVKYQNATRVGTATVTIKGQNNFAGTIKTSFTISKDPSETNTKTNSSKTSKTNNGSNTGISEQTGDKSNQISYTTYGSSSTYDGKSHGFTIVVSKPVSGYQIKYKLGKSDDYSLTEEPVYTQVGNYTVYYQITATGYKTETGSVTVSISPAKISIPQINYPDNLLTYTGNSIAPIFEYNSSRVSASGNLYATNAGTYTATFSLKDKTNYMWEDGTSSNKTVEWSIKRSPVDIPRVVGNYTYNGTTQRAAIDKYNSQIISLTGTTSAINAGQYSVSISLINSNYQWSDNTTDSKSAAWVINKKAISTPSASGAFEYTGEPISPVTANPEKAYVVESGDFSAINAGKYTAVFSLVNKNDFMWSDGTSDDKQCEWSIYKKTIAPPLITGSYTYSGNKQEPNIGFYNTNEIEVSGDLSATNAGSYKVVFNIKDPDNYCWGDKTTNPQTAFWSIQKIKVKIPSITFDTAEYDGEEKELTINDHNGMYETTSGTIAATDAGKYSVKFALKDLTNTIWVDNTSSDKVLPWEITRKPIDVPAVTDDYTFNESEQEVEIEGFDDEIIEVSGDLKATKNGEYSVKFSLLNSNYMWKDKTTEDKEVSWTIKAANILLNVPELSSSSFTYNGEKQTIFEISEYMKDKITYTGNLSMTNAGSYSTIFKLKDKDNYSWADGTKGDKIVRWSISPMKVATPSIKELTGYIYTGDVIEVEVLNVDEEKITCVTGTDKATDVGSYSLTYKLLSSNYSWSDGSSENRTIAWKIKPAALPVPVVSNADDLVYTGEELTPTFSNVDYTKMELVRGEESATNVGTYSVTFRITDNNYVWSGHEVSQNYVVRWTIQKIKVTQPTPVTMEFTANGENQIVAFTGFDEDLMVVSGEYEKSAAGEYTLYLGLKDPNIYQWDEINSSDNIEIKWSIMRTQLAKPTIANDYVYTGKEQPIVVEYNSVDSSLFTVTGDVKATEVGKYTATFALANKDLYEWPDGTDTNVSYDWTISRIPVSKADAKEAITKSDWSKRDTVSKAKDILTTDGTVKYTYTASHKAIDETLVEYYVVEGKMSLVDAEHYAWSDEMTATNQSEPEHSFNLKPRTKLTIPAVKGTYTFNNANQTVSFEDYDKTLIEFTGETTKKNAGDYSFKFNIKNKNDYEWSDGTCEEKTVTWKIQPLDISKIATANIDNQLITSPVYDPTVSVKIDTVDTALVKNRDFTYSFKDGFDVKNPTYGFATETIEGTGNYTGSLTLTVETVFYPTEGALSFKDCRAWANSEQVLRKETNSSSESIATVSKEECVTILSEKATGDDNWIKVKTKEGKEGYIKQMYLFINIPDYLKNACTYDIAYAYSALSTYSGGDIPGITGKPITGYENVKQPDGSFIVPVSMSVVNRLAEAAKNAIDGGYRLKIYDAFRPHVATEAIMEAATKVGIDDSYLTQGQSYHSYGIAVDVSMEELATGKEIKASSPFDYMGVEANRGKMNEAAKTLSKFMTDAGWEGINSEWWHYEIEGEKYAYITNGLSL